MRSEEDRATAFANMHTKFGKVRLRGCRRYASGQTDKGQRNRQTDKQTYSLQYFATITEQSNDFTRQSWIADVSGWR